jgi:putative membrane protein
MIGFLIRLAASVLALFLVAYFSNGAVQLHNVTTTVIAAVMLGIANALVKPVLYWIAKKVTCVLSCITLGLWSLLLSWLISGLIFYAAGQWLPGFKVNTFSAALLGALVLACVNSIASVVTRHSIFSQRSKK